MRKTAITSKKESCVGRRLVSRVSRLAFDRVRGENTPVLQVVIDQSGLMRSEGRMEWAKTGLWIVVGSGCVIAVRVERERVRNR